MDNAQARPLRNPSRTVAKIAVAVLIVIAIAGFVLAGLKQRKTADASQPPVAATREDVPPLTAPAPVDANEAGVAANHITFAPASDALSDVAKAKVVRLAESAKQGHPGVGIVSVVEAKDDRVQQMELARKRAIAVRQVLQDNGVPLGKMRIQIQEVPRGSIAPADLNRIAVALD